MHRHHEEQYGFLPWFAASDDFVIMIRKQNLLAFSLAPLMGFDMAWFYKAREGNLSSHDAKKTKQNIIPCSQFFYIRGIDS